MQLDDELLAGMHTLNEDVFTVTTSKLSLTPSLKTVPIACELTIVDLPPIASFRLGHQFPETVYQMHGWPRSHDWDYAKLVRKMEKHARMKGDIIKTFQWPRQFEGTYR